MPVYRHPVAIALAVDVAIAVAIANAIAITTAIAIAALKRLLSVAYCCPLVTDTSLSAPITVATKYYATVATISAIAPGTTNTITASFDAACS